MYPARAQLIHSPAPVFGVTELLGALTRIAGAAAALWGVGYYLGWAEESAYYSTLGCPWVPAMLPTSTVLQAALPSIFVAAIFGLFAAKVVSEGKDAVKTSYRWANVRLWIANGISLALLVLQHFISERASYVIATINSFAFCAATGFMIMKLVSTFAANQMKWASRPLFLLYLVIFFGLNIQPRSIGDAQAKYDANPLASTLPKVYLTGAKIGDDWRLISAVDQQMLVVRLAARAEDRTFRLVKPEDIQVASRTR